MLRAVSRFRSVLAVPRVRGLALSSLLARLPKGMMPLTLVVLISRHTGSYALAGTVTALFSLGDALTAPWQGRLVDRFGYARVLTPIAVVHVVATLGLIATGSPAVLCLLALAAGLGVPPISGAVKARFAELVPADRMPVAFAMESLLQQSFFLVGPLLATGLITLTTPALTAMAAATMVAGGTVGFVRAAGPVRRSPRRRGSHGALRIPAVRVLCTTTLLQSLTYGVLPVALVAAATRAGMPTAAGVIQAALTLGGVIGSVFHRPAAYLRLLTRFACCLVPLAGFAAVASPAGLVGLAVTLAGTGLLATPLATSAYLVIQRTTPAACLTEAFAWQSTGLAIGTAAGAAAGGALADLGGPALAFALPPVAVALAVGVVLVVRRRVASVFG